jgi:uncharacterized protein (DUF1330 family)
VIKVIGLIKILDASAFETYRGQVAGTVERYRGSVEFRGKKSLMPWNELGIGDFDAFVELSFPHREDAERWAQSPEYARLLAVRAQAMALTLFGIEP